MKYTFEKAEKSTVKINFDLTEKEWNEAIDAAYEKTKGRYSMPGFRKGKVPKHLLEGTYGKGVFYEEAINYAFPKYYSEILEKETSIFPVAAPEIDVKKINDKHLSIEAIVAVKPEVTLGATSGLNLKKPEYKVTDEDVEHEISHLQESRSRLVDVTDRAAENGDTVIIDYSGSVDGVKFDGGTAEKQSLLLGSGSFIPGFEDQVVGMKIGEDRDIKVKFPEEYHAENLKGKDAVFAIKLHEIKKKELPEVNDEFIKDAAGVDTVDAYKKETKERLEKQNANRAEREIEDQIIEKISETSTVEIPDAMIENQIDQMVQEMSYRLSYQGLKLEDYLKYIGQSMEDYRKNYRAQAEKLVKSQLVIEKIIETEKIEATDAEVDAKIEEMAKNQGKKAPEFKKTAGVRQLEYIKNDIIVKKLFDLLKSKNIAE